jgi:hypothetical protein
MNSLLFLKLIFLPRPSITKFEKTTTSGNFGWSNVFCSYQIVGHDLAFFFWSSFYFVYCFSHCSDADLRPIQVFLLCLYCLSLIQKIILTARNISVVKIWNDSTGLSSSRNVLKASSVINKVPDLDFPNIFFSASIFFFHAFHSSHLSLFLFFWWGETESTWYCGHYLAHWTGPRW